MIQVLQSITLFTHTESPLKDKYPEGMRAIYVVNTSWLVTTSWKWLKGFIPAATAAKVRFEIKGKTDCWRVASNQSTAEKLAR